MNVCVTSVSASVREEAQPITRPQLAGVSCNELDNPSLQYDQSRGPAGALRVEKIEIFLYSQSAGRSGPKLPTVTRSRPRSSGESRLRSPLAPPTFFPAATGLLFLPITLRV